MSRDTFGPPSTPQRLPRRFPIQSGRRPPSRECDPLEKGVTIPFPGRPYPCDFSYGRDEELLDQIGSADLMVPDDAAPPPARVRFAPWAVPATNLDDFGPFNGWNGLPGVVSITVPNGYMAYDAWFYASVRQVAWSGVVEFALYVNNKRVHLMWAGQMQEPVYVPLMARPNEGSVISLRGRVNTTAGTSVPRDQITGLGELHVRVQAQQESCSGGLECKEG